MKTKVCLKYFVNDCGFLHDESGFTPINLFGELYSNIVKDKVREVNLTLKLGSRHATHSIPLSCEIISVTLNYLKLTYKSPECKTEVPYFL